MKTPPTMTKAQRYLLNLTKVELRSAAQMHEHFFSTYDSLEDLPSPEKIRAQLKEMKQAIADYREAVETAIERLNAVV
jgi:hypothetical protein